MDLQKAIYDFVVATIPVVLVYFIGWSYLYFYFDSFGINIFELNLDLQAVFVYSYPPIRASWAEIIKHSVWSFIFVAVAVLFIFVCRYIYFTWWPTSNSVLKQVLNPTSVEKAFMFVLALVLTLYFFIVPLAKWSALDVAAHLWAGTGRQMVAVVNEKDYIDDNDERSSWLKSYRQCQSRRELALIFANENAYYMLCRSKDDPNTGLVFEVRRETGLASVRYANKS
jgi:hypothetical protein